MKLNFLFILTLCLCIFSCSNVPKSVMTAEGEQFGEPITKKGVITFEDMLKKMDKDGGFEGKVVGNVESVCQVKGCWMNIVSENVEEQMFVKFKDYGFFMPLDCSGKQVVMQGKAYKEVTSVDELRHYAEDEGLSKEEIEKITVPEEELKFMANGVLLLK